MRGTKTKRLRREAQGQRPKPGRKLGGADWRAGADPELLQTMRDEHAALFETTEPVVRGTVTGRIEHGLEVGDVVVVERLDESVPNGVYPVNATVEADGLDDLGIVALRKVAKPYKIPGAWSMKSAELRDAIRAARQTPA